VQRGSENFTSHAKQAQPKDEYLELRRYGSQAHQRDPLVRRQFHQPSEAQPHCSVSPSFSQSSLHSGVFSDSFLGFSLSG
jgi:hypothetical protein